MKKNIFIKLIIIFILFLILLVTIYKFTKPNKKQSNNKLTIAEVTHSPFYTPFYVAIEKGYFKEQGLDIELILTPGADKVSAAVLSDDVDIGLAGAESAMYIFDNNKDDYLKLFCGLTRIDGQFIVSRKKETNFSLNDLKNKEILVGRIGGMPSINFLKALENNNINSKDIDINYSIEYASLAGSFISGIGDYVNLFEPAATKLVEQGYGYIVGSIGKLSDEVPYTAFYAKKNYINNNKQIIEKFNIAIQKGIDYTQNNSSKDIAKAIHNQFNELEIETLTTIIENYKSINSWFNTTTIPASSFDNLNNMLINNNLLTNKIKYNDLVYKVK